jgi:hypothetical protein
MSDEPRNILAKLFALSAIQEARIKANREPFSSRIAEDNARFRKAIENALLALSGADDFDLSLRSSTTADRPAARNRQASELLERALVESSGR